MANVPDDRVTAREFQRAYGKITSRARQHPVMITSHGRDHLVLLSAEEYARLKDRDRAVYAAGELPGDLLDAVKRSTTDPRHAHLDAEIEDRAR
jgi:prevent-host-death family protein